MLLCMAAPSSDYHFARGSSGSRAWQLKMSSLCLSSVKGWSPKSACRVQGQSHDRSEISQPEGIGFRLPACSASSTLESRRDVSKCSATCATNSRLVPLQSVAREGSKTSYWLRSHCLMLPLSVLRRRTPPRSELGAAARRALLMLGRSPKSSSSSAAERSSS